MQRQFHQPVVEARSIPWGSRSWVVTWLLASGIVSSLLYVAADILATLRYEGYGYVSYTVSELYATGAPTRPLIVGLFTVYNLLVVAIAIGVVASTPTKRWGRLAGASLAVSALVGEVTLLFFPMDVRGPADESFRSMMHPPMTGVMSIFLFVAIGFGAALFGKRFRWYSVATMAVMFAFGAWSGMDAGRVTDGLATPGLGIKERIDIYAYLLWVAVVAAACLREGVRRPEGS